MLNKPTKKSPVFQTITVYNKITTAHELLNYNARAVHNCSSLPCRSVDNGVLSIHESVSLNIHLYMLELNMTRETYKVSKLVDRGPLPSVEAGSHPAWRPCITAVSGQRTELISPWSRNRIRAVLAIWRSLYRSRYAVELIVPDFISMPTRLDIAVRRRRPSRDRRRR